LFCRIRQIIAPLPSVNPPPMKALAISLTRNLRPLYDALEDMMPATGCRRRSRTATIEIAPLAYMRGRTLSDAFVILDEAQNATGMADENVSDAPGGELARRDHGDKTQIDLANREDSGLLQVERILPRIEGIGFCYLRGRGRRAPPSGARHHPGVREDAQG